MAVSSGRTVSLPSKRFSGKEAEFLRLYSTPGSKAYLNATEAASLAYNTTSRKAAGVIGCNVKKKLVKLSKLELRPESALLSDAKLVEKLDPSFILAKILDIALASRKDSDKLKAFELIGKYKELQFWKDNQELNVTNHVEKNEIDLDSEYKAIIASRDSVTNQRESAPALNVHDDNSTLQNVTEPSNKVIDDNRKVIDDNRKVIDGNCPG